MFLDVVKNCVLDELQERIRIITVTRETMKVLNMDLKYENSENRWNQMMIQKYNETKEKTVTKFSDCLLRCQNLCEILCFLGNQSKKVTYVPWEHKLKI